MESDLIWAQAAWITSGDNTWWHLSMPTRTTKAFFFVNFSEHKKIHTASGSLNLDQKYLSLCMVLTLMAFRPVQIINIQYKKGPPAIIEVPYNKFSKNILRHSVHTAEWKKHNSTQFVNHTARAELSARALNSACLVCHSQLELQKIPVTCLTSCFAEW